MPWPLSLAARGPRLNCPANSWCTSTGGALIITSAALISLYVSNSMYLKPVGVFRRRVGSCPAPLRWRWVSLIIFGPCRSCWLSPWANVCPTGRRRLPTVGKTRAHHGSQNNATPRLSSPLTQNYPTSKMVAPVNRVMSQTPCHSGQALVLTRFSSTTRLAVLCVLLQVIDFIIRQLPTSLPVLPCGPCEREAFCLTRLFRKGPTYLRCHRRESAIAAQSKPDCTFNSCSLCVAERIRD